MNEARFGQLLRDTVLDGLMQRALEESQRCHLRRATFGAPSGRPTPTAAVRELRGHLQTIRQGHKRKGRRKRPKAPLAARKRARAVLVRVARTVHRAMLLRRRTHRRLARIRGGKLPRLTTHNWISRKRAAEAVRAAESARRTGVRSADLLLKGTRLGPLPPPLAPYRLRRRRLVWRDRPNPWSKRSTQRRRTKGRVRIRGTRMSAILPLGVLGAFSGSPAPFGPTSKCSANHVLSPDVLWGKITTAAQTDFTAPVRAAFVRNLIAPPLPRQWQRMISTHARELADAYLHHGPVPSVPAMPWVVQPQSAAVRLAKRWGEGWRLQPPAFLCGGGPSPFGGTVAETLLTEWACSGFSGGSATMAGSLLAGTLVTRLAMAQTPEELTAVGEFFAGLSVCPLG
jgi:hypothetical protein